MNRFLLATVVAAVCSTFAGAADTVNTALRLDVGSTPALNDLTGIVNKNNVLKSNNLAISSSNVAAVSDDTISLEAVVDRDSDLPSGVFLSGQDEPIDDPEALTVEGGDELEQFRPRRFRRTMFCYRRGPLTQCGWRYPVDFWNRRGRFLFGSLCRFGQFYGPFYYC